jgi:hypothetical protein
MYKNKKMIACSPVGRKESMKCLFNHMLRHKQVIDEYHLWVNTVVQEDLEFIQEFYESNKDFVHLKYGCEELDPLQMGRANNVKRFYNYCIEPGTFYFKIDDDIIFIEDGTFEKLAQYKLDNPETFLTYPIIINNYWCTHFLRKYDAIDVPSCPICDGIWYDLFEQNREAIKNTDQTLSDNLEEPKPRDFIPEQYFFSPLYWRDSQFSYSILNETYNYIKENKLSDLDIENIVLDYEPVSIQFIMWSGEDFAKFDGNVKSVGDEPWLSMFYPIKYDLKNAIVGNTRVVHYAYWPQRDYLNSTGILDLYETLYS